MKMNDVRSRFKALGFNDVHSVLATGNIVFTTNKMKDTLDKIIGENLSRCYSFAIDVFVKDDKEIQDIFNSNPFEIRENMYIHTFIFNAGFENILREKLNGIPFLEKEKVAVVNDLFYWQIEKSMATKSHFFRILSRNTFKHHFTLRTMGSMEKICRKISLLSDRDQAMEMKNRQKKEPPISRRFS
jgi:uncharacterized protein (DUF1697 family)